MLVRCSKHWATRTRMTQRRLQLLNKLNLSVQIIGDFPGVEELLYRYKQAKTSKMTVLNIRKLYLYFVFTSKNAQPVASRQQAWIMLCCQLWTMLCCTQWTMLSTRLFSHHNNVVTALFNHQYCYSLLTRLSNNDNNNEQACSILFSPVSTTVNNRCCFINAEQHCWNNSEQHCSAMITVLSQLCSTNSAVFILLLMVDHQ